jgi:hypothetical protein
MLRDHGPAQAGILLTLYSIATFMNEVGSAFPAQATIAKASRSSVRTVRRHIKAATEAGWLSVQVARGYGQGWRRHVYRACVPAGLELSEADEKLRDIIVADHGEIDDPHPADQIDDLDETPNGSGAEHADTIVTSARRGRADTLVTAPSNHRTASQPTCGHVERDVRTVGTEDAAKRNIKLRTQLGLTKSSSEVSNRSVLLEGPRPRPASSDNTASTITQQSAEIERTDPELCVEPPGMKPGVGFPLVHVAAPALAESPAEPAIHATTSAEALHRIQALVAQGRGPGTISSLVGMPLSQLRPLIESIRARSGSGRPQSETIETVAWPIAGVPGRH